MPDIFEVGTLVEHPKRPEWGPGKVCRAVTERVYVIWRDLPDQTAKKLVRTVLVRAANQRDPILDNLPPLVEKNGELLLPAKRIPFQQAVDNFLGLFPQGFYDPMYLGDKKKGERNYKLAAHDFFVQNLGGIKLRELLSADLLELVKQAERCIGKVNLIYPTESAALRDGLKDEQASQLFFSTFADLLEADSIDGTVCARYFDAVSSLPAARGRVATWPVATILPYLAQPDRHMFLKPEVTKKVADTLGFELNYRSEPNWETYKRLLQMAAIYREKLAALKPRDLIDIQSFFWVACGGYD